MRLLEEFWYGNIEPTEYDTNACKEYKEVLRLITRNEEKLLATMTDEQKELASDYASNLSLFLGDGLLQNVDEWTGNSIPS